MGSLIKFELKKICSQRVTQVAVIVIAALLAWVTTFNITSQFALDPNAVQALVQQASGSLRIRKALLLRPLLVAWNLSSI